MTKKKREKYYIERSKHFQKSFNPSEDKGLQNGKLISDK